MKNEYWVWHARVHWRHSDDHSFIPGICCWLNWIPLKYIDIMWHSEGIKARDKMAHIWRILWRFKNVLLANLVTKSTVWCNLCGFSTSSEDLENRYDSVGQLLEIDRFLICSLCLTVSSSDSGWENALVLPIAVVKLTSLRGPDRALGPIEVD